MERVAGISLITLRVRSVNLPLCVMANKFIIHVFGGYYEWSVIISDTFAVGDNLWGVRQPY